MFVCTMSLLEIESFQGIQHRNSCGLIAQIGRARVCSLWLCSLPFQLTEVKTICALCEKTFTDAERSFETLLAS